MKQKQSSTISATQVHSILKQFNYEMVRAGRDDIVRDKAKPLARQFPGIVLSSSGDSIYFRFNGESGKGPSQPFFVQAKGMMKVPALKHLEKLTGIKFADHLPG